MKRIYRQPIAPGGVGWGPDSYHDDDPASPPGDVSRGFISRLVQGFVARSSRFPEKDFFPLLERAQGGLDFREALADGP